MKPFLNPMVEWQGEQVPFRDVARSVGVSTAALSLCLEEARGDVATAVKEAQYAMHTREARQMVRNRNSAQDGPNVIYMALLTSAVKKSAKEASDQRTKIVARETSKTLALITGTESLAEWANNKYGNFGDSK